MPQLIVAPDGALTICLYTGGYNRGGSAFGGGNMGYANPAGYNMGAGGYGRGNAMYGQGAPGMAPYK